jgi:tetratricopeptide (TPR) repeat protein
MEVPTYAVAAAAYALVGIGLGVTYRRNPRLREHPGVQAATLLLIILAAWAMLRVSSAGNERQQAFHIAFQGLLFFAASLCHLPVLVYILLQAWNQLIERITSPGRRDEARKRRLRPKEEWALIQSLLEALARNPVHAGTREQLADCYLRLGYLDSAIHEYRKAIDCMERGYAQSRLMFMTVHLLVDRKQETGAAVPLLRRLIRLYPKSYFASYARRILNQHEARQLHPLLPPEALLPPEGS